jgi:uncharacterized membrane protein (DUF485 family)
MLDNERFIHVMCIAAPVAVGALIGWVLAQVYNFRARRRRRKVKESQDAHAKEDTQENEPGRPQDR